jgi:hypothetical protein
MERSWGGRSCRREGLFHRLYSRLGYEYPRLLANWEFRINLNKADGRNKISRRIVSPQEPGTTLDWRRDVGSGTIISRRRPKAESLNDMQYQILSCISSRSLF